MDNKDLIKMRDALRESADIIDEVLALEERENNEEDVRKELESAVGRFTIKMLELNSL